MKMKSKNLHNRLAKVNRFKNLGLVILFSGIVFLQAQQAYTAERLGYRGDYKVVSGYIQEVVNDKIKVGDHYYNITNVHLKNKNGREISKDALTKGSKIEMRIKDGIIKELTFIHGYIYD